MKYSSCSFAKMPISVIPPMMMKVGTGEPRICFGISEISMLSLFSTFFSRNHLRAT